jgi:hypothetical protein
MPTAPIDAETDARAVGQLYAQAEMELFESISKRVGLGIPASDWQQQKLADTREVMNDVRYILRRADGEASALIPDAVFKAYSLGTTDALEDLASVPQVGAKLVGANVAGARAYVREAQNLVGAMDHGIFRQVDDIYRQIVTEGAGLGIAGAETRLQATQRILDRFADKGITGFVDSAGRNWGIDTYAEMATRTTLNRAAIGGHVDTLKANDQDLVLVSDSPEECPLCRPWEGRVLSLTGKTRGRVQFGDGSEANIAGTVDEARAAGLFHPNCTHRFGLFIPGLTKPMKGVDNPEGYEDRQRQREIERNIRKWKKREAVAIDGGSAAKANAKVKEWQAAQRQFVKDKDRKRLYYREQIQGQKKTRGPAVPGKPKTPKAPAAPPPRMDPTSIVEITKGLRGDARLGVNEGLKAMSSVHQVPVHQLKVPVVTDSKSRSTMGYYQYRAGQPVKIGMNSKYGSHHSMTFVHEMGHLIDHQFIGPTPGTYGIKQGIIQGNNPLIDDFFNAITNSHLYDDIQTMMIKGEIQRSYGQYLVSPEELWARAYAQYIATKSGNPVMLADLAKAATPSTKTVTGSSGITYSRAPQQWDAADFGPISDAIEALLKDNGMMD